METTDLVQVIRCKDCVFFDDEQCYHPRHEHHAQSVWQNPDDFCNYAELNKLKNLICNEVVE